MQCASNAPCRAAYNMRCCKFVRSSLPELVRSRIDHRPLGADTQIPNVTDRVERTLPPMTVRSHSARRQFEVTRWRLRTASSTTGCVVALSGEPRLSGNTQQVHAPGPCHLVGEDDDSESSCRLFTLPCALLQHILSLCDGRTVCHPASCWPISPLWPSCHHTHTATRLAWQLGALDCCCAAFHRPPHGAPRSLVDTAVRDAALKQYGPRRARLLVRAPSAVHLPPSGGHPV